MTQPVAPPVAPAGLLTVEEVARAIRRHPEVVRRQARAGRLPADKIGRGWFFRPERLVAAGYSQFEPTAAPPPASQPSGGVGDSLMLALSRAGSDAVRAVDRDAIFQAVGRRLHEVGLGAYFFLLSADGQGLTVAAAHTGEAGSEVYRLTGRQSVGSYFPFERVPILRRACETRQPQYVGNPEDVIERIAQAAPDAAANARRIGEVLGAGSAISAPLVAGERLLGAITVLGRDLHPADLPAMMAFANQTAAAMEAARLLAEAREAEEAMSLTLATLVEMKDPRHVPSLDLAELLDTFADELELDRAIRHRVRSAALLHDLGKIGIPDAILNKQGPLDPAERAVIMTHPALGADLLERVGALASLAPVVRSHHEWFDGGGYPAGLKGDAIPIESRIVGVVHAFVTMISNRPYRAARTLDGALAQLRDGQGTQFDPGLVETFLAMLDRGRLQQEPWYRELTARAERQPPRVSAAESPLEPGLTPADARQLRIIYRIAQETSAFLDLDVLLQRIVSIVRDVMGYYFVALLLPDEATGGLRLRAHSGYQADVSQMVIPAGQGVTGWVFAHGVAQIISNVAQDSRYVGLDPKVRSELAFPLMSRGRTIGVLNVESEHHNAFGQSDVVLMSAVGSQLAAAVEVAQLHDVFKREAKHDPLTRLYNRRPLLERLGQEIVRAERTQGSFSLVFLDVDSLKAVNDGHGHLVGDALLREVAAALLEAVREGDVVARYGGDEFVVLLPALGADGAAAISERISQAISRRRVWAAGESLGVPGVSLGIASFPESGRTVETLLAAADATLYRNKRAG